MPYAEEERTKLKIEKNLMQEMIGFIWMKLKKYTEENDWLLDEVNPMNPHLINPRMESLSECSLKF